ncbi:MAG: pirin-like C-terminal cupin domain-containing protein [Bacteroidia bacterium]
MILNQVALFERGQSDIQPLALSDTEMLVLGGQPLDEVVYAYGLFVMNTEEQIRQCINDYQSGKWVIPGSWIAEDCLQLYGGKDGRNGLFYEFESIPIHLP